MESIGLNGTHSILFSNGAKLAEKFRWPEYVVFVLILVASSAIGIFYGCFGSKQKTAEEFLMANRQMSSIPVALSLICSFVSAITILGTPIEVYFFSSQIVMTCIAFIPLTLALGFLYIPVYWNLKLNSVYQYLNLRFRSRGLQVLVSAINMFYAIIYMAVCVHAPALGLSQVTGFDDKWSTAAVFLVCIFYSSLGGLKAVLWTDSLQALILAGSLVLILVKGIIDTGGLGNVLEISQRGGRLQFFNFDVDPRTRHTFWTATVGGFFFWLPAFVSTQAQLQRFLSMPSLSRVWRALLINMLGFFFLFITLFLCGLVIYAKYYDCDPVTTELVKKSDQILPLYVMEILGDIPGLPGIFVGGITCASLSSVSSALNSLASIMTYDYIKVWKPTISEAKLSFISKTISAVVGLLSFGLIYVAEYMGNVVPAAAMLGGILGTPVAAIFTLGMFFPWANAIGCLLGLLTGTIIQSLFVVGTLVSVNNKWLPDQKLPVSIIGCSEEQEIHSYEGYSYSANNDFTFTNSTAWKGRDDSVLIQILSLSYVWVPTMGFFITLLSGFIFSVIVSCIRKQRTTPKKYFSQPVLLMWEKIFSRRFMLNWVDFHEDEIEDDDCKQTDDELLYK